MKRFLVIPTLALTLGLAGCYTPQDRALGGAALGGVAGATIGGLASNSAGGAVAGGLIGAAGGAMVGAATAPRQPNCYYSRYYGRTVCR